jgi:hypothetical protein
MISEKLDYAILISLAMREEAEVMASALRAEKIAAFVGNAHHANVDWGWTLALGGMQVFVPHAKIQEAKDAIRRRIKEAAEHPDPEAEPTRRRDHWKVWALVGGSYLLAGFGIPGSTSSTLDGDRMNQVQQAEMQRQNALGFDYGLELMPYGPEWLLPN